MKRCLIGIDVGLTAAKGAAFDECGVELHTVSEPNLRVAIAADRQEIDMPALWDVVAGMLSRLTTWLTANGWTVAGVGVTGHGNGLYLVDENLSPVRPAFASTDSRGEGIVASLDKTVAERVRLVTGSVPWAAQPGALLRWLSDHEPESLNRSRWALSCKDWIVACLTGLPSADYSDASACGLVNLSERTYEPAVFDLFGLPRGLMSLLPELGRSDEVFGTVAPAASARTGLPVGTPVVAGCMDCVASPIGAGSLGLGDVTVIAGTWAISSVVVPVGAEPPRVTLNALLPHPERMLALEVAPTSAAGLEWFSSVVSERSGEAISGKDLLQAASMVPPGADGLLFLPFVHGAPEKPGASGTLLGLKDNHGYNELARAVAEGITQYYRVQLEKVSASGAAISETPWTLVGGGARNLMWTQMFADIVEHPVYRQLDTEMGARGVASLAAVGIGLDPEAWRAVPDAALIVTPGADRSAYRHQSARFDRVLNAMRDVWAELAR
jgi:L-xylulokinase